MEKEIVNKNGKKPYKHTFKKTRTYSESVYLKGYNVISPDPFEHGYAYSLHTSKEKAKEFKKPFKWYSQTPGIFDAFVTKGTLEKIIAEGGNIFTDIED